MKLNSKNIISINGFNCKYHIWGKSEENPIIIFVHGGPGIPIRHKIKKYFKKLRDAYTLVAYDQRGIAGSYSDKLNETNITVDHLVDDLIRLADYFLNNSSAEKVYLIGESFGSLISTLAIKKKPSLFSGYIGFGQFVSVQKTFELQKAELLKLAKEYKDNTIQTFVSDLPEDLSKWTDDQFFEYNSFLYKTLDYGRQDNYKKAVISPMKRTFEYNFKEKRNWAKMLPIYTNLIRNKDLDISNLEISEDIPFFVFNGERDFTTPTSLAKEFVKKNVTNKNHRFVLFESCGHSCAFDQPERFMVLVRKYFGPYRTNLLNED